MLSFIILLLKQKSFKAKKHKKGRQNVKNPQFIFYDKKVHICGSSSKEVKIAKLKITGKVNYAILISKTLLQTILKN